MPLLESLHLRGYRFGCHSYYDNLCRCKRIIVTLVPCAQLMRKQWTMSPKLHVCAYFMYRRQKCLFGSRKVGCFLVLNSIFLRLGATLASHMEEELHGNHPLWLLFGSFGRKEICCVMKATRSLPQL